jgi:hypothetical protein
VEHPGGEREMPEDLAYAIAKVLFERDELALVTPK